MSLSKHFSSEMKTTKQRYITNNKKESDSHLADKLSL